MSALILLYIVILKYDPLRGTSSNPISVILVTLALASLCLPTFLVGIAARNLYENRPFLKKADQLTAFFAVIALVASLSRVNNPWIFFLWIPTSKLPILGLYLILNIDKVFSFVVYLAAGLISAAINIFSALFRYVFAKLVKQTQHKDIKTELSIVSEFLRSIKSIYPDGVAVAISNRQFAYLRDDGTVIEVTKAGYIGNDVSILVTSDFPDLVEKLKLLGE